MNRNLTKSIKRALELIRSGKLDTARPILLEILREDEAIEQAWFLLSYTLPPGEKQEYALNQALSINPEFDRARDRLDQISDELVEPALEPKEIETEKAAQESRKTLGDVNVDDSVGESDEELDTSFPADTFLDGEDLEKETVKISFSKRTIALTGLVILFLIILLLVTSPGILTNLFGLDQAIVQPTQVQGFRTLPPTWTP